MITLPVFINKFNMPFEMNQSRYLKIYNKFTTDDQYFKLDEFIPTPGQQNSDLNTIMSKLKGLL